MKTCRLQNAPRHACELTVAAVLLAIVLHTFAAIGLVTPVYISAGSMAQHVLGPHWNAACRACGLRYPVGADAPPQAGRTSCPACGHIVFLESQHREQGDKLYVERVTCAFRPPRRWEPIVFRCPHDARTLCVKRVVGLPGEMVQFDSGDLLVDGQVQRKSLAEQTALRILVHRERASAKWWRPRGQDSAWHWTGQAWRLRSEELPRLGRGSDWLEFATPSGGPVTDRTAYNAGVAALENPTGDLMLTFRLSSRAIGAYHGDRTREDGLLWIDCGPALAGPRGGDRLWITISPERRKAWIGSPANRPREETRQARNRKSDEPLEVAVSLFDRQLLVVLDGAVTIRRPLDGPVPANEQAFALAASGFDAELRDLAVWRDVVYTERPAGPARPDIPAARWRVGSGEYFVVGDNPAISHDSRTWRHGPGLRAELLVGRPLGLR